VNVNTFLNVIAANIDWYMRLRHMNQESLAEASGVSPRTVGNFLRPENRRSSSRDCHTMPSGTLANLYKLAWAMGVEAWELLDNMTPEQRQFHDAIERAYQQRCTGVEDVAPRKTTRRKTRA